MLRKHALGATRSPSLSSPYRPRANWLDGSGLVLVDEAEGKSEYKVEPGAVCFGTGRVADGSRSSTVSHTMAAMEGFLYGDFGHHSDKPQMEAAMSLVAPMTPEPRKTNLRAKRGAQEDILNVTRTKPEPADFMLDLETVSDKREETDEKGDPSNSAKLSPTKPLDKKGLRLLRNRESAMRSRKEKKANLERLVLHNRVLRDKVDGLEVENTNLRAQLSELIGNQDYQHLPRNPSHMRAIPDLDARLDFSIS